MCWCISIYVREIIGTIQTFSGKKDLWKFKKLVSSFPPTSGSKRVTEIRWKQIELYFHPRFIYEGFTSLCECSEVAVRRGVFEKSL